MSMPCARTQLDEDGKYLSHDRKVYAPAGDSSATAAVGPMSCPPRHHEAMRMPVAEDYVALVGSQSAVTGAFARPAHHQAERAGVLLSRS